MASFLNNLQMLWEEHGQRPWWWWWQLCIILWYSGECCVVTANGMLLSQVEISCDVRQKRWQCKDMHQEWNALSFIKKRRRTWLRSHSTLLSWPVQVGFLFWGWSIYWKCNEEMRQLMSCLLTLLKPCFINSLPGIGITAMYILLLVNKSTRDYLRIGNCAGTTMGIMVNITVQFLILWNWWKWKTVQFKNM